MNGSVYSKGVHWPHALHPWNYSGVSSFLIKQSHSSKSMHTYHDTQAYRRFNVNLIYFPKGEATILMHLKITLETNITFVMFHPGADWLSLTQDT